MTTVSRRPTARLATLAALLLLPLGASALERVGPVDPVHGFPRWYQDPTGVTLDLCVPADEAEAALCALPDVPPLGFPESFPLNWVTEHFYWVGDAIADNDTTDAILVLALESTFAADEPVPGDQIVFGRMRIRVGRKTAIPDGLYRVYTPYGVRDFNVAGGAGEINQTWDIGFACAQGTFDCALQSDINKFLLPADEPGGNELAPITVGTRQYIADPAVPTFVTGSTEGVGGVYTLSDGVTQRNANIFLVERVSPNRAIIAETYEFAVAGRLFNGTIVPDAKLDRASYARDGAGTQIDVYATGFAARPKRVPAGAILPVPPHPEIAFYSLPCDGPEGGPYTAPAIAPVPLARDGNTYWARELDVTLPRAACFEKILPSEAPIYESIDPLPDQVMVTRALYMPDTRTFVVEASSSDVFDAQLEIGKFGSMETNLLLEGGSARLTLPEPGVPPATLRVISNQGGVGIAEVATRLPAAPIPASAVELTASLPSPQVPGTAVTFTAQGLGSPFPYEYRFFMFRNGAWEVVQEYSPDNTWVLPANTPAGTYEISVHVRTSTSVELDVALNPATTYVIAAPSAPPATGVSLTPSVASPHVAGTEVTFTAQGQGSTGTYQYRFWLFRNGAWEIVQDFSTDNTWVLPANTPIGVYSVSVHVRANPNGPAEAMLNPAIEYQITGESVPPATGVTMTSNLQSPQPAGTQVIFTASGEGSTGTYQYRFWLYRNGAWEIVQDFGTANSWSFPSTLAAGIYGVSVHVRTSTNGPAEAFLNPEVTYVLE